MDQNAEQVLIIYSVNGTSQEDLRSAQEAVLGFRRPHPRVRVRPKLFRIPNGAAPGETLGTELTRELRTSIGAVVFVDDLRPNVAYELGFFHGQGRTVLLLTRQRIDSVWTAISDLAGAALAAAGPEEIESSVHGYLSRLYDDLGLVEPVRSSELPSNSRNQLAEFLEEPTQGPWGAALVVNQWDPVDLHIGANILPDARYKLAIRAIDPGADLTVYFRVRFGDREGTRRRIWLGLASRRQVAGFTEDERTLPAQAPTDAWRVFEGSFSALLRLGAVLGTGPPEFLETVRFRAGTPHSTLGTRRVQVGFLGFIGLDR